jgi:fructokinase
VLIPPGTIDVLTVGETVIDLISEEEADSLNEVRTFRMFQGGSVANLALYVARMGGVSALMAKTGHDAFGVFIRRELARAGVRTDAMVLDDEVHTTVIFITRTPGTADSLALRDGDYRLTPEEVDEELIGSAKVVHASTFALSREPARSAIVKALRLAHDRGKIVSLDPNYNPPVWPDREEALEVLNQLYPYVTLTKPSRDDAERLFGPGLPPEAYVERYHEMGARVVVFTMGAEGVLLSKGKGVSHLPARRVEVADATGAGDAFWAGFLVALLDGNSEERSVLFAREVAARKMTTLGPLKEDIHREEIYARLDAADGP